MSPLLATLATLRPDRYLLQIGGDADPLADVVERSRWRGVIAEPVPAKAERLERRFGELGRMSVERVAISSRDGTAPFFHDPVAMKGALRREVLFFARSFRQDLDDSVVETSTPTLTV